MFSTITARYPGTCRRCKQTIEVGERIRFGGPGRTYHLKANCPLSQEDAQDRRDQGTGEFRAEQRLERIEERAEFGYDGRQMGYMPNEDGGDF